MSKLRKSTEQDLIHPLAKQYPTKYCKWCGCRLSGKKTSFCCQHCVHEWSMRTSPSYARECVLARDKGICSVCGLDTLKLEARIYEKHPKSKVKRDKLIIKLGFNNNRALWEADHLKSVHKGGGMCSLDNYVTACYRCHLSKTKKENEELRKSKL